MDGLIEVLISERLWLATHSESFNAYKNTEIIWKWVMIGRLQSIMIRKQPKSIMEVKTKYDIEDNVWMVSANKVVKTTVTGLGITLTGPDSYEVDYSVNYSSIDIPENQLFRTKEELLESL